MTWLGLAAPWLGLSTVSGAMLGTAGMVVDGPETGLLLAAIAVALPLYYAGTLLMYGHRRADATGMPAKSESSSHG